MDKNTMDIITQNKIIVIVRNVDSDNIIKTVEALKTGGIKLVEVTFDQSGRFSDEHISKQIGFLAIHSAKTFALEQEPCLTKSKSNWLIKQAQNTYFHPIQTKQSLKKLLRWVWFQYPGH